MGSFFFSSRRRHTRFKCDWSSDVCSSDLALKPFHLVALFLRPALQPGYVARVALQRVCGKTFLDLNIVEKFADEIALVQPLTHRDESSISLPQASSSRYKSSGISENKTASCDSPPIKRRFRKTPSRIAPAFSATRCLARFATAARISTRCRPTCSKLKRAINLAALHSF